MGAAASWSSHRHTGPARRRPAGGCKAPPAPGPARKTLRRAEPWPEPEVGSPGLELMGLKDAPTVCALIDSTSPSATSWRASSGASHAESERPFSSGRSQASLTACSATTGGKNRRAAGAWFVLQAGKTFGEKARGPLAHVPHAHTHFSRRGREALAPSQQQNRSGPAHQAHGGFLLTRQRRQLAVVASSTVIRTAVFRPLITDSGTSQNSFRPLCCGALYLERVY